MSSKRKSILVTGVAGFLGSHLAEKLVDLGHNVIGLDNMIGGYEDNVPKLNFIILIVVILKVKSIMKILMLVPLCSNSP